MIKIHKLINLLCQWCWNNYRKADRHHCFTSGNIRRSRVWPDSHKFCDSLMMLLKKLTQKQDLLEWKYFTGSMSLFTPSHNFRKCGSPEALASTTIYEKCGVKTSSGGQEHYCLKIHLEISNLNHLRKFLISMTTFFPVLYKLRKSYNSKAFQIK